MLHLRAFFAAVVVGWLASPVAADDFQLEPGFKLLFNGQDLTGWKVRKSGVALEGKAETPDQRFKVAEGLLVVDAKAKGDVTIDSVQELAGDVHVKFDFLPGAGCNNDLYLRGLKFDLKQADVKNMKQGEWNSFEIVIAGEKVEFKCNGELLKTEKPKNASSPLGIRAELGPIQIRRLRYK